MKQRSVTHATFTVERTYPVPASRVFAAFAKARSSTATTAPPCARRARAS
ncbi:hypothetical protein [Pyxidicoccus xibeiensis]|nr:hypothetical protein [Pyxidicoccus xibeiensis]MCP3143228.1 hypothetical protein [Pyxidicoccus xibeiensis]